MNFKNNFFYTNTDLIFTDESITGEVKEVIAYLKSELANLIINNFYNWFEEIEQDTEEITEMIKNIEEFLCNGDLKENDIIKVYKTPMNNLLWENVE